MLGFNHVNQIRVFWSKEKSRENHFGDLCVWWFPFCAEEDRYWSGDQLSQLGIWNESGEHRMLSWNAIATIRIRIDFHKSRSFFFRWFWKNFKQLKRHQNWIKYWKLTRMDQWQSMHLGSGWESSFSCHELPDEI